KSRMEYDAGPVPARGEIIFQEQSMPRPRKKFEKDAEAALNAGPSADGPEMGDAAPHKVSFVFPHALVRRLDVIAHEQTVGDRSVIVRTILSDHIAANE